MQNDYIIHYSKNFLEELRKSILFVANVSKESALNERKLILNAVEDLKNFPYRGQIDNELEIVNHSIHKLVIKGGRYIVLYSVDEHIINVRLLLDARRDNTHIKDLL